MERLLHLRRSFVTTRRLAYFPQYSGCYVRTAPACAPMTSPSNHRLAGLDTLRACAIVWVMAFHLQGFLPAVVEPVGNMGWLGVDLFFVLSGYLIGSQLLRSIATYGHLNIPDFYRRRAYRILPA
jgi:peptidoglycan/LPS O-acetylase OafA/YrhL